jgi:hypothetical protein
MELTPIPGPTEYAAYVAAGGVLSEDRFTAALPGARAAVDAIVWPNAVTDVTQAAYDAAVYAAVDLVDSPPVRSERVGRTGYDYADVPTLDSVIRRQLAGTGLLYAGI